MNPFSWFLDARNEFDADKQFNTVIIYVFPFVPNLVRGFFIYRKITVRRFDYNCNYKKGDRNLYNMVSSFCNIIQVARTH